MANICEYHVLVKGAKNACHALFGGLPVLDDKWITTESGSDEDCSIVFQGTCKWSVDSYTGPYSGPAELNIPADPQEAEAFGEGFWGVTLQEKSRLFGVEVWCNSLDIDDSIAIISEHYYRGESRSVSYEDMPQEIAMEEYASECGSGMEPLFDFGDCSEEKAYLVTLMEPYSDDQIRSAVERMTGISEGPVSREDAAQQILDVYLEDGGLAIMDFEDLYEGDLGVFKAFFDEEISSIMEPDDE